ncbi:MAG: recombinase family protein [Planctomycetales bacterium]|nr:recombinase family protein [bacterium]MCB1221669.1 recombinase family protein [bacterium]UNM08242.1 MAG: recombinase family protein [Planctomycetales bacterium]
MNRTSEIKLQSSSQVIRCAIYTRVSSEEGLNTEFTSLDNQLATCLEKIENNACNNWTFFHEYREAGITARSNNRPQFKQLMHDIQDQNFDILIVHRLDRLVRRMSEYQQVIPILEKNNVGLVSVQQEIDGSTAAGRMLINILMTFAEFEVDITCERQREKAYAMRKRGMRTGGRPILGYDIDPVTKQYIVNKEEAKLVNEIFQRFADKPKKGDLVRELNAEGKTRKTWTMKNGEPHDPGPFTMSYISRLLANRTYIGVEEYHRTGETFPGLQEPIVAKELFDRVQSLLNQNAYIKHSRERSEIQALLKHIVFCKSCNEPMAPKYAGPRERAYYEYVCRTARNKGYRFCPNPSVPAKQLEALVVEQIRVALRTDEVYLTVLKQLDGERERTLKILIARKQKLESLIQSNQSEEGVRTSGRQKQLDGELKEITAQCNRLELAPISKGEVANELQVFDRIWDNLFPREQERIAKLLVKSVTVAKGEVLIELFDDGLASLVREIRKAGTEIISVE